MKFDFANWSVKKKIVVSVVGSLFTLSVVGAVFGEDPQTSNKNADNTTVPKSSSQVLLERVEKEAGKKSNLDGFSSRIRNVAIQGGKVSIEMNGNQNLTEGLTKSTNRRLVLDALKALKSSGVTYESAYIAVYYPLVNNLGEMSVLPVLRYTFSFEQIGRIQPENVDTKGMDRNFADLGTVVHPAFAW